MGPDPLEPDPKPSPTARLEPAISSAKSTASAVVWVVAAIVIALGAAGLVAAMEPGPDRPVVPGLTSRTTPRSPRVSMPSRRTSVTSRPTSTPSVRRRAGRSRR